MFVICKIEKDKSVG
jgi:hypothetical protein